MASYMNIPTKSDVAKVAKLSIQAEEKIDILEEQIWNLQESFELANKENQRILWRNDGIHKANPYRMVKGF